MLIDRQNTILEEVWVEQQQPILPPNDSHVQPTVKIYELKQWLNAKIDAENALINKIKSVETKKRKTEKTLKQCFDDLADKQATVSKDVYEMLQKNLKISLQKYIKAEFVEGIGNILKETIEIAVKENVGVARTWNENEFATLHTQINAALKKYVNGICQKNAEHPTQCKVTFHADLDAALKNYEDMSFQNDPLKTIVYEALEKYVNDLYGTVGFPSDPRQKNVHGIFLKKVDVEIREEIDARLKKDVELAVSKCAYGEMQMNAIQALQECFAVHIKKIGFSSLHRNVDAMLQTHIKSKFQIDSKVSLSKDLDEFNKYPVASISKKIMKAVQKVWYERLQQCVDAAMRKYVNNLFQENIGEAKQKRINNSFLNVVDAALKKYVDTAFQKDDLQKAINEVLQGDECVREKVVENILAAIWKKIGDELHRDIDAALEKYIYDALQKDQNALLNVIDVKKPSAENESSTPNNDDDINALQNVKDFKKPSAKNKYLKLKHDVDVALGKHVDEIFQKYFECLLRSTFSVDIYKNRDTLPLEEVYSAIQKDIDASFQKSFNKAFETEFQELKKLYLHKPVNKTDKSKCSKIGKVTKSGKPYKGAEHSGHDDVIKNKKLEAFFGEMCQKDDNRGFIPIFLRHHPIVNECIKNLMHQCPIHLAIKAKAFRMVKELLAVPDLDVNVRWKTKTPLFLLFELLTLENYEEIKSLSERLVGRGADINQGDHNHHPLSVVCNLKDIDEFKKREFLEFCIKHFKVDVDTFYDGRARTDIESHFQDLLVTRQEAVVTVKDLKFLLEKEEKETEKETEKLFVEAFEEYSSSSNKVEEEVYELLRLAALNGKVKCVEKILNDGKFDVNLYPGRIQNILKRVCEKGEPGVLESFLRNVTDTTYLNIHPLLLNCVKSLNKERTTEVEQCFVLLLSSSKIEVEKSDGTGQTALHFAVNRNMEKEAIQIMTTRHPQLGKLNKLNMSPLHDMRHSVLKSYLDSCVFFHNKDTVMDLRGFSPVPNKKELDTFGLIANSKELRSLLKHPTIETFLRVKWIQLRWFIYLKLFMCILFTTCFTTFAVLTVQKDPTSEVFRKISIILNLFQIAIVVFCIVIFKRNYFYSLRNYLELVVAVLALISCFIWTDKVLLSTVVLLAGIDVVIHMGSLPIDSLSTSIVMMETLCKNFLKSISMYVIILIAFGFSFFIMFADDSDKGSGDSSNRTKRDTDEETAFNNFSSIGSSMMKTVVMFTGEFDAGQVTFVWYSYIMFIVFIYLITLVISNLINGLAVSDISEIRRQAEEVALAKRVRDLMKYNKPLTYFNKCMFFEKYYPAVIIQNSDNNKVLIREKRNQDTPSNKATETQLPTRESDLGLKCRTGLKLFQMWPLPGVLGKYSILKCYHSIDPATCETAKKIVKGQSRIVPARDVTVDRLKQVELKIESLESKIDQLLKQTQTTSISKPSA